MQPNPETVRGAEAGWTCGNEMRGTMQRELRAALYAWAERGVEARRPGSGGQPPHVMPVSSLQLQLW